MIMAIQILLDMRGTPGHLAPAGLKTASSKTGSLKEDMSHSI